MLGLFFNAGCASFFGRGSSPEARQEQKIWPVAVVEFLDLTGQEVGASVTRAFWIQARSDLSGSVAESLVPRPGARLAASWLKAQGASLGVGAFLTGVISGYRVQEGQKRVWVSLTVRLMASDTGRILWSKRLVGTEALDENRSPESAFERAVRATAREFTHDFSPSS